MKKTFSTCVLLLCNILIGIVVVHRWFSCWLFKDTFYFTPSMLANSLLNATNEDRGVPLLLTRILHNKVVAFPWGVSQTFLQYWDIRFLEELIGIVGAIGVYFALWYLFTKFRKNIFLWILVVAAFILEFFELFHPLPLSYGVRLIPLAIIFEILSVFGLWQFLSEYKGIYRHVIICILLILSVIALFLFPLSYQVFCLKV